VPANMSKHLLTKDQTFAGRGEGEFGGNYAPSGRLKTAVSPIKHKKSSRKGSSCLPTL